MAFCGNSIVDLGTTENCDDGNDISGDGCSANCTKEVGWECTLPGTACCKGLGSITTEKPIRCIRGYWTDPVDGVITLTNTSNKVIPDGILMCGVVVLDNRFVEDENNITLDGVTLTIDGSLVLYVTTVYFVNGGNISLIDGHCGADPLSVSLKRAATMENPLWMSSNSSLWYTNITWTEAEEGMPQPMIISTSKKCIHTDGVFGFVADEIPNGSNKFQAITTQCIEGTNMTVQHDIPGTCSDVELWTDDAGVVTVNRKHLCTGSIVAMSVVVPTGLAAMGAAAWYSVGYTPATGTDYYSL